MAGNFWVGLALLHSLFMREHNAICDHLHAAHPDLEDDELFDKARLVVAALMAKIHTVDWTPAIIAHPTTVRGMRANWWGLEGEKLDRRFGRLTSNEVIRGIPGSPTNHHGVPYALTEEFVAVYRMHPLIPDDFSFRSLEGDAVLQERTLEELGVLHVRERLTEMSMGDVLYSFGTSHPGAITLHNFPRFLQDFHRADGTHIDLASIDVLRVRERGVPRYNEFRRLLHLKPFDTFEEMADTPEHAEDLRRVYGDVERVDTMIGMYAERKPQGLRFQRHRLPPLHPDGVAPAQERPVLHPRLPTRGLHAGGARRGWTPTRCGPCFCATSPSSNRRSPASQIRSRPGSVPARRGFVIELAPGIHRLGHRAGGRVSAFLVDDGGELSLVDTLFESDARLVLEAIHRLGKERLRPEADCDHARSTARTSAALRR